MEVGEWKVGEWKVGEWRWVSNKAVCSLGNTRQALFAQMSSKHSSHLVGALFSYCMLEQAFIFSCPTHTHLLAKKQSQSGEQS